MEDILQQGGQITLTALGSLAAGVWAYALSVTLS